MSNYFTRGIAVGPKRILCAEDEHTIIEIAIRIARDMALHGYLRESAMVVAPLWNSAIHESRDFSLEFVSGTMFRCGLDLIWRGANFIPMGFDRWRSGFDAFGYTEELIEAEQRTYFCSVDLGQEYDPYLGISPARLSWPVIRGMLSVWEDPTTHMWYFPVKEIELDALERLEAYIGQELPTLPGPQEWFPCILGLELSLKYGEPRLISEFLSTIAAQIARVGPMATCIIRDLVNIPRAGYIASNSTILRHATGFTRCRARDIAFETAQALDARFCWGEVRPYAGLSWAALLSEIEAMESRTQDEEQESDLPFIREPASPEKIAQAEKELGITLSQDYKEFLAVSNGLGSFNRYQITPLLPVNDIFWDAKDDELKVEYRQFDLDLIVAQLPSLQRVLQVSDIAHADDIHWWLIEPGLIREAKWSTGENSPAEWLGVNYAEWQPKFSNRGGFRMMMERRLSDLMLSG